jgi:hypothetical protein
MSKERREPEGPAASVSPWNVYVNLKSLEVDDPYCEKHKYGRAG